ncbi:MAG: TRAP transporter TatT component family protein, partial [Deltaproteobacteria bacterium]|nr:TRAP transporter TatT component family protein [Deltaproteobacteria bacterium]
MQDDDPELIRDALPFALKTYEALLASDPKNRDLCLTTADVFVKYASAFVHADAERLEKLDFQRAQSLRRRAKKLYLRGRNYALAGLTLDYPDFEKKLRKDPQQVLHALSDKDVPLLFWAAAGWAGAISTDVNNMSLIAELPMVEAMMCRALELDEDFEGGAIHEFFITYEGSRSEAMGGSAKRAREHFARVVQLTRGEKASPYVSLASSVAVRKQDYQMFKDLLQKALAIDPDAVPKWRLANILAQEKAQWLLDLSADLFLDYE